MSVNKKVDDMTFNLEHAYQQGSWSKFLDRTLPEMFNIQ